MKKQPWKSAAEKRYYGILSRIRSMQINGVEIPQDKQQDLAYTINDIKRYGFGFFPNHYLFEKVDHLEQVLNQVESSHQYQQTQKGVA